MNNETKKSMKHERPLSLFLRYIPLTILHEKFISKCVIHLTAVPKTQNKSIL